MEVKIILKLSLTDSEIDSPLQTMTVIKDYKSINDDKQYNCDKKVKIISEMFDDIIADYKTFITREDEEC